MSKAKTVSIVITAALGLTATLNVSAAEIQKARTPAPVSYTYAEFQARQAAEARAQHQQASLPTRAFAGAVKGMATCDLGSAIFDVIRGSTGKYSAARGLSTCFERHSAGAVSREISRSVDKTVDDTFQP